MNDVRLADVQSFVIGDGVGPGGDVRRLSKKRSGPDWRPQIATVPIVVVGRAEAVVGRPPLVVGSVGR